MTDVFRTNRSSNPDGTGPHYHTCGFESRTIIKGPAVLKALGMTAVRRGKFGSRRPLVVEMWVNEKLWQCWSLGDQLPQGVRWSSYDPVIVGDSQRIVFRARPHRRLMLHGQVAWLTFDP